MLNGYPFRLYPNPEQEQILLPWIGCPRLIYNAKVQEDRYFHRFAQRCGQIPTILQPLLPEARRASQVQEENWKASGVAYQRIICSHSANR